MPTSSQKKGPRMRESVGLAGVNQPQRSNLTAQKAVQQIEPQRGIKVKAWGRKCRLHTVLFYMQLVRD